MITILIAHLSFKHIDVIQATFIHAVEKDNSLIWIKIDGLFKTGVRETLPACNWVNR